MEQQLSFEEKLKKLEKIIEELEKDDINLDASIENYSLAMQLIKECDAELKKNEDRISKIVKENGEIANFDIEN